MPYKTKTCPTCNKEHNKRGPYCSRSCGNIRQHSDEVKSILSKKLTEYHQTPEGLATREKSSRMLTAMRKGEEWDEVNLDDYAINIPDVTDYVAEYDSTWDRAEKW